MTVPHFFKGFLPQTNIIGEIKNEMQVYGHLCAEGFFHCMHMITYKNIFTWQKINFLNFMKVGISILLFGVVLMFRTGASGEHNLKLIEEKSCYQQPEGNIFFLTRASIWTRGPRWAVRQSSVKGFAQNILTHETVILFCHQHCYLYWRTNISLHISHFQFWRHYPNWTGQAENFRLEMRPSQGFPKEIVDSFASDP